MYSPSPFTLKQFQVQKEFLAAERSPACRQKSQEAVRKKGGKEGGQEAGKEGRTEGKAGRQGGGGRGEGEMQGGNAGRSTPQRVYTPAAYGALDSSMPTWSPADIGDRSPSGNADHPAGYPP